MARDTFYSDQALAANDEFFSVDDMETAVDGSFSRILEQYAAQSGIQNNTETPEVSEAATSLYISDSGFAPLFGGVQPRILYIGEGNGARDREENTVVDQVVLHSFGYAIDRAALRAGAQSIQVDERVRGYNPYKLANRMQQVLFSERQSTTHLISRRGDIVCAAPWNRGPAVNGTGQARQLRVPGRSISIELESWHTAYGVPFRGTPEASFKVLGLMPYTAEQFSALAFLLKKLGLWSNTDPTAPLGFTFADVRSKVGSGSDHVPGIVNISTLDRAQKNSPGGEFELPVNYAKGDPIPAHLDRELWERRMEIYYGKLPNGVLLSRFSAVKTIYDVLPNFSFESELFAVRNTPIYTPTPSPVGGQNAAAQENLNAAGNGTQRSQIIQLGDRSGFYNAAAIANDAVIRETASFASRQGELVQRQVSTPIIRNALAFDFSSGQWVIATTRNVAPQLPVARRAAPTPTT